MPSYRLSASLKVLKRAWEGECVVYLKESRETHLLNPSSAYVLDVLDQGLVSQKVLTEHLRELLPDIQAHEVSSLLQEMVDTLSRIRVIETVEDAI